MATALLVRRAMPAQAMRVRRRIVTGASLGTVCRASHDRVVLSAQVGENYVRQMAPERL